MIQHIGGVSALLTSGYLLWDVSTDFSAFGQLIERFGATKEGRIALGKLAIHFHLKLLGAWALAIVSGVLLS